MGSARAQVTWRDRLERDRTSIVPWIAGIRPLPGLQILEIGGGRGASTFALAEQGAHVVVLDVNDEALGVSATALASSGLRARYVLGNAASPPFGPATRFDVVAFWASFEHMTASERRSALAAAWSMLGADGVLLVIEAPNRLWPLDSHTSDLPFFQWLPDELATRYKVEGLRGTVAELAPGDAHGLERLGRGVSFHDFADEHGRLPQVVACMQLGRRASDPFRRIGWSVSRAGRTERLLRSYAPRVDRAWFQPFHYLALRRPSE